jgi:dipeptidase D
MGKMMSKVIAYFKKITKIPHCSQAAQALRDFLVAFAKERGYEVETDEAGNILARKGTPVLCLQAHYDMVCMGKAPEIEIVQKDGIMRAKESSLGADNGMAVAMMMALMDEGYELEFLFTADEEIGLIGADALAFELSARYLLNLDSEEEAEVYVGCAGGADIVAHKRYELAEGEGETYEVCVSGLPGGHSGVDIDKNIPNALSVLAEYLDANDIEEVVRLQGGTRRNAIPDSAVAYIRAEEKPAPMEGVHIKRVAQERLVYEEGGELVRVLHGFKTGVRRFDETLGIPYTSINLAIVRADDNGEVTIETSARAMDAEALDRLIEETVDYFTQYGFTCEVHDKYPAWKPHITPFTETVEACVKEVFGRCERKAIHAGLECGVIAQKYPHLQLASVGPSIRYPHSTREEVDLASVERTFQAVKMIAQKLRAVV